MPDTRRITLTTDDEFFLIGCDGLWDVMTYEEAIGFVKERLAQGVPPQKLSENLVKEALKRGSKDNITVLVLPHPVAPLPHCFGNSLVHCGLPCFAKGVFF